MGWEGVNVQCLSCSWGVTFGLGPDGCRHRGAPRESLTGRGRSLPHS